MLFRQRPSGTGIILGVLVGSFLVGGPASAGTLSVQSVVLDAIGVKHGHAEYVISLTDSSPSPPPISTMQIGFLTSMPGASTSVAEVLNIPSAEVKQIQASMQFALFVPAPDIHRVSIHYSTIDQRGGAIINDDAQIDVSNTDSTPLRFDDSSSWIGELPSAFAFLPSAEPAASPAPTEPSGLPKIGEVTVRVYFDARGSVVSAKVVSSSGMPMIDAALDEARNGKISPALLITPEGNEATPSTALILFTFINDQPGN